MFSLTYFAKENESKRKIKLRRIESENFAAIIRFYNLIQCWEPGFQQKYDPKKKCRNNCLCKHGDNKSQQQPWRIVALHERSKIDAGVSKSIQF